MPTLKVFISSTYIDLEDYRKVAIDVMPRYKCLPIAMENFMAQPAEPTEVCKKEIQESDIFIGVYAHRYGFVPGGKGKSITQQEYELAKKLGKDCLCFIVSNTQPWLPEYCEFDKRDELIAFLNSVKEENTIAYFTSIPDFENKLTTSLGNLLLNITRAAKGKTPIAKSDRLIPIAPTPFIAHPYPLPQNFTGREAEKSLLSNWFYNAKEPMLVVEAIGGMGKSALTWVWLQEILEKPDELAGVIWWSFYDAPFETFLPALYHYLTSQELKIEQDNYNVDLSLLFPILYNNNFLLVLDGFERALRGYAGMSAMFIQEKGLGARSLYGSQKDAAHKGAVLPKVEDWDKQQRQPVHPFASRFLQYLANSKTKTLMTTRLFPAPLEEIAGVQKVFLTGFSRTDAVRFLKNEGITGSRAELERAGEIYQFHPLMLKQLSTAIKRTRERDIESAFRLRLIDQAAPQKILQKSFDLLNKDEQRVACTVSVLRSAFSFESVQALLSNMKDDGLWHILQELRSLGFLLYDDKTDQFDFHPIMRSFLYDSLTAKDKVHQQAVDYFEALPKAEKVVTLDDLAPVIELYHHLIGAGKYDEAMDLFYNTINKPTYYQLSAYNLRIELLKELFPDGEDQPPRLKQEGDQAWTSNSLANSYSLSGQPAKAVPFYLMQNKLREKNNDKRNLAIGLGNVACMAQIYIGQLSAAAMHKRKWIALCQEIEDEFEEAVGHQELGWILAYQGRFGTLAMAGSLRNDFCVNAEDELAIAYNIFDKDNIVEWIGKVFDYRSLNMLLCSRLSSSMGKNLNFQFQALEFGCKAIEFADREAKTGSPVPRDLIRAYWLLGESLIQIKNQNVKIKIKPMEIHFYDEPFQAITGTEVVQQGNELTVAERCLTEALRRCRKVNLVEMEADILLACARLEWANRCDALDKCVASIEATLKEAKEIAERAGYRLQLADIYLFCGEVLLEKPGEKLLGATAKKHLKLAKEYAKDVSKFEDLYIGNFG